MRPRLTWLSLFCMLSLALIGNAWGKTVSVNSTIKKLNLSQHVRYFQTYSIADISAVKELGNKDWQQAPQESNTLNFGYNEATFWVNFSISNNENNNLIRFLEVAYPVLDHVDIYVFNREELINAWKLGDKLPFDSRPIKHHHFVVPLNIPANATLDFYIRVRTTSSVQIPLILWDEVQLLETTSTTVLSLGLYYGTMMVMVLYNLFVFFSVRETTYLYYVFFVASMGLFLASINGISYQYLWPNELWWNDQSIVICLTCALIFGALFTLNFLKLEQNKPHWARGFKLGIGYFLILLIADFVFPYSIMIRAVIFTAVITIFIAIPVGIIRWHEGDSSAKYYTVAWFTLLFGGIILALNKFNLLPRNGLTENATQLGSALEVILLSLALADRLNTEKRARYEAQETALENERLLRLSQAETLSQEQEARVANEKALALEKQAREAQAQALEIQQRANETLELRVKERTNELEKANRKLEQLTFTDGLTGIRNRRYFDRAVDSEFHRAYRDKTPLSLLVIDIDHFKKFNDLYGHLTGDDCLRAVAHTIRGQIHRDSDVVARYGGEEFVILMPNTDPEGAAHIAEKVRSQVEALAFRVEDELVPVTISVGGITHTPKDTQGQELFVASADEALYESKANGRNRATLYNVDHKLSKQNRA